MYVYNELTLLTMDVPRFRMLIRWLFKSVPLYSNSQMQAHHIRKFCTVDDEGQKLLERVTDRLGLSARTYSRILKVGDGKVTFRYRESDTGTWRTCTLTAEEFLRRFLQHVLPKGFVKVRYYGLFSPSRRYLLPLLRLWLGADDGDDEVKPTLDNTPAIVACPVCGHAMRWIQKVRPRARCPPPVG